MDNYKDLYLMIIRASEKAINILIEAQKKCETMYIDFENLESNDCIVENNHSDKG